jgi:hypothetical protein
MKTKTIAIAVFVLGALLTPATQALAVGTPAWHLALTPLPTNLRPGSVGTVFEAPLYRLVATNIGGAPTSGPVSLAATLPPGITPVVDPLGDDGDSGSPNPICKAIGQSISCTAAGPVYPGRWLGARIPVEVSAASGEVLTAVASVGSGGASTVTTSYETEIGPEPPGFGFLAGATGLSSLLTRADGAAATQAGSHPDQLTINLAFPADQPKHEGTTTGAGHVRSLVTDLPQGLIANPSATAVRCTEAELVFNNDENEEGHCRPASQIGMVSIMTDLGSGPVIGVSPLYNMVPPPGAPAELGFEALNVGIFVHVTGGVRSDGDYGLSAITDDIIARPNNPILSVQAQLWGDPSGASHDEIRGECRAKFSISFCPVQEAEQTGKPFLTMPSACSRPITTKASANSWEEPNPSSKPTASYESTDTAGNLVGVDGCSALKFNPSLTLHPDAIAAETPTGVHIDLSVPQDENKEKRATSNLKDAKVVFPVGMALNPAAAGGLSACTPVQIGMQTGVGETPIHFSSDRPQCPDSSKIGTVEVDTPLLDHPVPGAVYVAQPYANPFGSLLGAYVVIDDPVDGIVAKLAGKTEADPKTGQLTVTFTENPELPFEHFKVDLFGGPRAALRTPSTCGTFDTTSLQTPWSGTAPVPTSDSFKATQGANGRPCVSDEAQMPSDPSFEAGTQTPIAASYSPFVGRLQRADGTQQLKGLNLTLPPGLTGKLAGIETCSDAGIAASATKTGVEELASPSCPPGSQIGEVKVGAGAGPQPYYTTGKIYLAGPYEGAPISGVVITPAVAGPFDLGTVVVRAGGYIDPVTAQLSIRSGEFPRILEGVPLELRDAQLGLNKSQFTLNPTSCDPMAFAGEAISVLNYVTPLSQRFQAAGCRGLDYEPKLAVRLFGGTGRGAHPRLRAILTAKLGEANTARVSVALPHSEFLENAHIGTVCTRVQFAADSCPTGAVYGHAKVITPLLDEPLEGPVYLRSSNHRLPDMVLALKGPPNRPIKVELNGRIDSVNGGIRSTFDFVPDQPVSKAILSMRGGKKGLLVNSRNLCARTYRATAKFDGQNGKVHDFRPEMKNDCEQHKKGKSKRQR